MCTPSLQVMIGCDVGRCCHCVSRIFLCYGTSPQTIAARSHIFVGVWAVRCDLGMHVCFRRRTHKLEQRETEQNNSTQTPPLHTIIRSATRHEKTSTMTMRIDRETSMKQNSLQHNVNSIKERLGRFNQLLWRRCGKA